MNYFKDCKCLEDLRKTFKTLCFKYHPDVSDIPNATEIMKEINAQYDEAYKRLKNVYKNKDGETYTNSKQTSETADVFKNIINQLITLEGLKIELIGRWIWVSGNTKEHKEILKNLKFRWCKNKGAWSWHRPEDSTSSKGKYTLDDIRNKYDVTNFKTKTKQKLEEKAS